jgi:hypothetical protein
MGVYEHGVEHNGQIVNTHSRVECDVCCGTGTTGEKVPYFDNSAPPRPLNGITLGRFARHPPAV